MGKLENFSSISNSINFKNVDLSLILLSFNGIDVTKNFLYNFNKNTSFDRFKIRLIWIDNGSTDDTINFLKSEVDKCNKFEFILIPSNKNLGVIDGRNYGCNFILKDDRYRNTKYIMYLDNDQYVCPGWLNHHISVLNQGYDLVGVEAWSLTDLFLPYRKNTKLSETFSYVGCGGMIKKTKVVEDIGIFDSRFNPAYFEDPDYNFRAYKAGYKIGWNFKAKIIHMAHQTLGSLDQNRKNKILQQSWGKFKDKWTKKDIPILKQKDLPEFH